MRGCPVRRGGSAPKGRTPGASASGRGGAERRRLEQHMAKFVSPDLGALVFAGPTGAPIWRSNFGKMSGWTHAVASIGAEGLHFHDLRHTGNTFAAAGGAGIKHLMARMGHDSERAAMIYQHRRAAPTRPSPTASTLTWKPSVASQTMTTAPRGVLVPVG